MLKHVPWIKLGSELMLEYEQCFREGRDVAQYETACREIAKLASSSEIPLQWEPIAANLAEKMANAPLRVDFPFVEPSTLPEILAASSQKQTTLPEVPEDVTLADRLHGAWTGRIAGCLLGKPVEGWRTNLLYPVLQATDNYPMKRYIRRSDFSEKLIQEKKLSVHSCWADNIHGIAPIDDDTNYTVFALKLVEQYGKNFQPADVMEAWLSWIPMLATCTAERAAYRNGAMGLLPPETATVKNPYREWIGAQIRGDFFGYVNPGNPAKAAEMAFRDASISHVKNGIYGEMYIAAMLAAAAVTNDVRTVIETGLAYVPERSRMTRDVRQVIGWYESAKTGEEIIAEIQKTYDEYSAYGWCFTNPNAMIVTMALLCGEGKFGRSVCLAVQSGFDTDCNGATVGSIVGMMRGGKDAEMEKWRAPFGDRLSTSIDGYNTVNVEQLTNKTLELIHR